MSKILGLDLGTNSIGWAVVDTNLNKIEGIGSRIFPEGVNRDTKGAEVSKNETRRTARGARKQQFRRKIRKRLLLIEMAKHGMCPLTDEDVNNWKIEKKFPDTSELREWFKENPYELRKRALDKPVSLMELGRIFYHMAQRRGFKSNRKEAGKEDGKVKSAISQLGQKMKEGNHRTLGEYFAYVDSHQNRIRDNYTDRQMYIDEFNTIWKEQAKYHKELTGDLKIKLGISADEKKLGVLFYYRPLRSQKYLIGKCTFEHKKTKCPVSAIPFELYRAYQYAHTIECNGQKLGKYHLEKVVEKLKIVEKTTFKIIKKVLDIEDGSFNYSDDDRIIGCYTISKLSKLFGKQWKQFSDKEKEDIWHTIFSCTDADWLDAYAKQEWNFNAKQLKALSSIHFKQDYASLSRKAINNILPFLYDYPYHVAVVMGGVKNAFGTRWDKLTDEKRDFLITNIPDIVGSGQKGGFMDDLKAILKEEFGLSDKQLGKLYHHSASIKEQVQQKKLPMGKQADREISGFRNPIVMQTMFELRKLINALIDEYGSFDKIKVEMARDLKNSAKKREEIRFDNKQQEKIRDIVKKELDKLNKPQNHESILIYRLWEECQKQCPYTGKQIGVEQLFSGEVQIEHIIPWSRSLDDSFMNKTLCFADENRAKGDKTPYEFYSQQGEKKWNEVKERAIKLFHTSKEFPKRYNKFKRFANEKEPKLDSFISRQLNDTRYISKEAKNILGKVCEQVQVAPGQMTAHLRHHWGLNKIINKENDIKNRNDHRHHAIDAIVMACFEVKHLQQLSNANRYNRNFRFEEIERPWDKFWEDAKTAIDKILVAHKSSHRIITTRNYKVKRNGKQHINKGVAARGQLHKEFVYGKRQPPGNDIPAFHMRKPLEMLTTRTHVEKIVDERIKGLIQHRIEALGGYIDGKKIPVATFFTSDEEGNKQPQIFLPNKNGNPIPVRKVRIHENIGGAEQLHDDINGYVNPRNNHHVLIYRDEEGNLKEQVVTFWTAVERKKQGDPVFQLPPPEYGKPEPKEIVTTMQINDLFLLGLQEDEIDWDSSDFIILSDHLFRVQKLTAGDYWFRNHLSSTIDGKDDYHRIRNFGDGKTGWLTFNPIKVRITRTGKIEKLV